MAFGEQDSIRLCEQYREAIRRRRDEPYELLSERLNRVEQAVQFLAALQSVRALTEDEVCRLVAIAKGQAIAVGLLRPRPAPTVRVERPDGGEPRTGAPGR